MDQEFDGKGLTPYDPTHNSTYILAGTWLFIPPPSVVIVLTKSPHRNTTMAKDQEAEGPT